jgi:hypothetical protein
LVLRLYQFHLDVIFLEELIHGQYNWNITYPRFRAGYSNGSAILRGPGSECEVILRIKQYKGSNRYYDHNGNNADLQFFVIGILDEW